MRKRIFALLLALVLCLALLPVRASAAPSGKALTSNSNAPLCDGNAVSSANEPIGPLNDETDEPEIRDCYILDGGIYYLSEDVTIDKSLLIKGDTILDLNGHVLKLYSSIYDGTATGSVIVVNGDVNFTLKDSNPTAPHKLKQQTVTIQHAEDNTHGEVPFFTFENGIYVVDDTNGTIPITGGIITGGLLHHNTSGGKYGGGVWVRGGFDSSTDPDKTTFTMQGGNIVGCAADNGGGVYAARATFTMEGGCIKGCAAESFGGVGSSGGNFTMRGGTMEDCTANRGGAVGLNDNNDNSSSFTMQGGTISDCKTVKPNSGDVDLTSAQMTANGGKVCGTVYIIGDGSGIISTDSSSSTTAFYDKVTNIGYTISATNTTNTGTITGGVFYGEVENAGGSIAGGVFYGTVTNSSTPTSTGGTSITGTISDKLYTATFDLNYTGSTSMAAMVVGDNTRLVAPVDPTREDYHFAGWYMDTNCTGDAASFPCEFTNNGTFYANWHALGEWKSDSSQHGRSCTVCDFTTVKDGHTFDGGTCTVCGYEEPAAPGHEPIRRQNTTPSAADTTTTDTTTDVVTSAKTFDTGVAVYGAMAIASLLGMGYVGKKRV